MHNIVTYIIAAHNQPTADQKRRTTIVQALSILVDLFHEGVQLIPARAAILRAMPLIPRYAFPDRTMYDRWNSILLNLSVETADSRRLDLASYHALLGYTLRHRRSIDIASGIIKALCAHHSPTIVTYNILLRELTLLRYNSLAESIISRLIKEHGLPIPVLALNNDASHEHEITQQLRRHPSPAPDEVTLSAIMSNFIARGEPKAACEIVTRIFPKLRRSKGTLQSEKSGLAARIRSRRASPHFWAIAVNAALKSSSLTFAARVWSLAAAAELGDIDKGGHRRRAYSVEAYTSHLQLFVKELQKIYDQTDTSREEIAASDLLSRYGFVLRLTQRVLFGLRKRTQSSDAADLRADALLFDTLLALAEVIIRIEQYSERESGDTPSKFKQQRPRRQHHQRSPAVRTQDMIRAILSRYNVHVPDHLRRLGFHELSFIEAPLGYDKRSLRRQPAIRFFARPSFYVRKTKYGYRIAYTRGFPKVNRAKGRSESLADTN
jgi:hypothetical protein